MQKFPTLYKKFSAFIDSITVFRKSPIGSYQEKFETPNLISFVIFNIIVPSMFSSLCRPFPLVFPTKIIYKILFFPIYVYQTSTFLILFDLVTRVLSKGRKLWADGSFHAV